MSITFYWSELISKGDVLCSSQIQNSYQKRQETVFFHPEETKCKIYLLDFSFSGNFFSHTFYYINPVPGLTEEERMRFTIISIFKLCLNTMKMWHLNV